MDDVTMTRSLLKQKYRPDMLYSEAADLSREWIFYEKLRKNEQTRVFSQYNFAYRRYIYARHFFYDCLYVQSSPTQAS